jgi:hypothetical protein
MHDSAAKAVRSKRDSSCERFRAWFARATLRALFAGNTGGDGHRKMVKASCLEWSRRLPAYFP